MTDEERTRHEVLLEDVQKDIRLIAEGHVALTERLDRTEARFEQRFEQVERQIMVLDVSLNAKIDALDERLTTKIDALGGQIVTLSGEIGRIATHLGLNGAAGPRKRPPANRGTRRRKAR